MIAQLTIKLIWLPLIIIVAVYSGFLFRSAQISKFRKRVVELENEMLRNHAEILRLQQELAENEKNSGLAHKSRVVPMKESQPEENADASHKKKLK